MQESEKELIIQSINRHKAKLLTKFEELKTPQAYLDIISKEFHFIIKDIKEENFNYTGNRIDYGNRK